VSRAAPEKAGGGAAIGYDEDMLASRNLPFLDALTLSGLLTPQEIEEVLAQCPATISSGEELARVFVEQGVLTPFQTWQLLQGRWRGLVMGDFRILGPISRAGMGRVFLAQSRPPGRKVAIKLVRPMSPDDEEAVARLRLEAFASMTLEHPNILRGIEYDRIANAKRETYYLAMEFIPGPNLAELRAIKRTLPWRQACGFAQQAACGLHVAHEAGFVHRDVKPSNLLVSAKGKVKLIDFGLAQYSGPDRAYHTSLGKRLGTPDYVAPEQTKASQPVDRRADVYGLGCTLYFLLSGSAPFPALEVKQKLRGHRREEPPDLRDLAPEIPAEVAQIVQGMMAKAPEDRPQTMFEVAGALQPFSEVGPVDFDYQALLRARARLWQAQPEHAEDVDAPLAVAAAPTEPDPLDRLRQQVDSLASQLSRSQAIEEDLREQLREEQGRAALEREEYEVQVELLREELEGLRPLRDEIRLAEARHQAAVAAMQQELDAFRTLQGQNEQQLCDRGEEIDRLQSRLEGLQEEVAAADEERGRMQQTLAHESELRRGAETAREIAEARLQQYRARVNSVTAEIERLTGGLGSLDGELALEVAYHEARHEPPATESLHDILRDDDFLSDIAQRSR